MEETHAYAVYDEIAYFFTLVVGEYLEEFPELGLAVVYPGVIGFWIF